MEKEISCNRIRSRKIMKITDSLQNLKSMEYIINLRAVIMEKDEFEKILKNLKFF